MKLIRLATTNDGVFTSSFGNDMNIEPNSSMALLNLTFNTDVGVFVNSGSSAVMQSDLTDINSKGTYLLESRNYEVTDSELFFKDIQHGLNGTLQTTNARSATLGVGYNSVTSAFRIATNPNGTKNIQYRYAPFINPFINPFANLNTSFMIYNDDDLTISQLGADDLTTITMKTGVDPTILTLRNTIARQFKRINDGSSIMTIRIANFVDNTSGNDDNGFGIGLSTSFIQPEQFARQLPADQRNYEIRFGRDSETYKYVDTTSISLPVTEKDSGVNPYSVDTTEPNENDVLFFEVNGNVLEYGVYQENDPNLSYVDLADGNDWTQAPVVATERFDTTNLGSIATYRRTQVGSAVEQWWESVDSTNWNYYNTGPPTKGQTPDGTATINVTDGVITVGGTTFTPAGYGGGTPTTVDVPQRNVFASIDIKAGTELYPYIYINGKSTDIALDSFNFSIDPWMLPTGGEESGNNDEWFFTGKRDTGLDNGYTSSLSNFIGDNMIQFLKDDVDQDRWELKKEFLLQLPSNIWHGLGFEDFDDSTSDLGGKPYPIGSGTTPTEYWTIINGDILPIAYLSDNFMVISDSLALDSYDASKSNYDKQLSNITASLTKMEKLGRRKNILMTIPVNDNINGVVEYEASTPIFVDLNNAESINQRNLNFRVLRKDFTPISQGNSSALMTILIKKPGE
jgi:hypothetical protein